MKKRDVAWGFFMTDDYPWHGLNTRRPIVFPSRALAKDAQRKFQPYNPGPIFRITPPAKKGKK